MITQDLLKELFEYRDGNLYWKVKKASRISIGDKAGTLNGRGYIYTGINGKDYRNHRLIFLMCHGYLPKCVDHINGNTTDNRIENLRDVTQSQNIQNSKKYRNNTSGAKGVQKRSKSNKWQVQIYINKKYKYLGTYEDLELAELVAIEARNKYHKEFANHGN